ncbi:NADH-flavin reductase [Kitasatospora herbaricolor]|uniref:NAD(P)-dependent oxidoreductase n=1 Tax=Kitasatospora herbaricolor TaxID=68217 RepID=UPI00174E21CC|nr:NAD(P)H-binding protein [Kitasatospora herbaricolor]MDQ0307498.1 putative NADH-flavin reductase [Kitasatospora herbaricolor]GGV36407.1 NADH-flavin reductase [Kitasatospora herbaricolor]
MKIVILAATGGIGRELLDQALAAGHEVTVVVRNPDRLSRPVRAVRADLAAADPGALEGAVAGADAVLSGLGARSSAEAGVAWRGTRAITAAMTATGVRRIVVVSAAPIGTVASPGRPNPPRRDPGDGFLMSRLGTPIVRAALRKHYADLARMEDVLRAGTLDWTVVRPPRLTDKPLTADYRTAYDRNIRGGAFASRADVAHLMLRVLGEPESVGHTVGIAN